MPNSERPRSKIKSDAHFWCPWISINLNQFCTRAVSHFSYSLYPAVTTAPLISSSFRIAINNTIVALERDSLGAYLAALWNSPSSHSRPVYQHGDILFELLLLSYPSLSKGNRQLHMTINPPSAVLKGSRSSRTDRHPQLLGKNGSPQPLKLIELIVVLFETLLCSASDDWLSL